MTSRATEPLWFHANEYMHLICRKMSSTMPELSHEGVTSDDVTVTSLGSFQQQQQIAVDVDHVGSGNNVDEMMEGISNSQNDIRGRLVYTSLNE